MDAYPKSFELMTPEEKGILGSLDENGRVTFVIAAGPESSVRGTEMFNRMMGYFGDEVRCILGVWNIGQQGTPSTNIDKVNELTATGMPLEEAILHAWTVTRARKLGFDRVRVFGKPIGSTGNYTKVDVLIEKGT
jgi:hypothetical protein